MSKSELDLRAKWKRQLASAIDCDGWGQVIEAAEEYEELAGVLEHAAHETVENLEDRALVKQIALTLRLRARSLSDVHRTVSLAQVKSVSECLEDLFSSKSALSRHRFPIDLSRHSDLAREIHSSSSTSTTTTTANYNRNNNGNNYNRNNNDASVSASVPLEGAAKSAGGVSSSSASVSKTGSGDAGGSSAKARGGTLLRAPPPFGAGGTMLVLVIEKIGLKAAPQYLQPRVSVSWRAGGRLVEEIQETAVAAVKREQFVEFNAEVFQQASVEEIVRLGEDAAVFFEFQHYKPKKDKVSTKCWSFLPLSAVQEGPIVLEIYEKPTDFKCKKLKLLTSKPLYLHLHAKLIPH